MMTIRKLTGACAAALMAAGLLTAATTAEAAMAPVFPAASNAEIQTVGCFLGAHLGPLGACIGGGYHRRHCWINRWGHRRCAW